jgi:hypothetical protein
LQVEAHQEARAAIASRCQCFSLKKKAFALLFLACLPNGPSVIRRNLPASAFPLSPPPAPGKPPVLPRPAQLEPALDVSFLFPPRCRLLPHLPLPTTTPARLATTTTHPSLPPPPTPPRPPPHARRPYRLGALAPPRPRRCQLPFPRPLRSLRPRPAAPAPARSACPRLVPARTPRTAAPKPALAAARLAFDA